MWVIAFLLDAVVIGALLLDEWAFCLRRLPFIDGLPFHTIWSSLMAFLGQRFWFIDGLPFHTIWS
jgi:hypothetical protein